MILMIYLNTALAHEFNKFDNQSKILYRNTFEKFFIFNEVIFKNHSASSNYNPFDYLIYWESTLKDRYFLKKNNRQFEPYMLFLEKKLDKLNIDLRKEKISIVDLSLDDYYHYIHVFHGEKIRINTSNRELLNKKIKNDIFFFDKIMKNFGINGVVLTKKIIESEVSLIVKNQSTAELIEDISMCNKLTSSLKYTCFSAVLNETVERGRNETILAIKTIRDLTGKPSIIPEECHFLNHEVGFFIASKHGMRGMGMCLNEYDGCTFGCYHGIAEYIFFENNGNLENNDFSLLQLENDSFAIFAMYHAIGHGIYRHFDDVRDAKSRCSSITKNSQNRAIMCYSGITHEFVMDRYFENISFENAAFDCEKFNNTKEQCYRTLGYVYSFSGINKSLEMCYSTGSYSCIEGVGAYIDGIYADGNLSKSFGVCDSIVKDMNLLSYCYKGILITSLEYYNNITRAFSVCNLRKNAKAQCYNDLKSLYDISWLDNSVSFCHYVDDNHKKECYAETAKYWLY